jgi:hypothetical protein
MQHSMQQFCEQVHSSGDVQRNTMFSLILSVLMTTNLIPCGPELLLIPIILAPGARFNLLKKQVQFYF